MGSLYLNRNQYKDQFFLLEKEDTHSFSFKFFVSFFSSKNKVPFLLSKEKNFIYLFIFVISSVMYIGIKKGHIGIKKRDFNFVDLQCKLMLIIGKALMSIKESFSNVANVLLDWDDVHNDDFCSWRGVTCSNFSTSVAALYVFCPHFFQYIGCPLASDQF